MCSARILQLSDCHLFADPQAELKEILTRASFEAVLSLVRDQCAPFDRLIVTGDLAHDERLETYSALRDLLAEWLPRCRLIPGNHDNRKFIRQVFPEIVPAGQRADARDDEPIGFAETCGGWRLIGLDSHVPGQVHGSIADSQLEWLGQQLSHDREAPTILFLHHPPVSVGSAWLDKIGLMQPEPFIEMVKAAPQVRAIFTGHAHQDFESRIGEASVLIAPSTAVQFVPQSSELQLDSRPPGLRLIELDGPNLRHRVVRIGA